MIEWIAQQPWCDGNIGMVGIGAFASEQFHAARQQPPLLKAIFPYDPRGAYGKFGGFREEYPGGVLHAFRYLMDHFSSVHTTRGAPGELPPEKEEKWREAMADPDIRMYPHLHNVLLQRGQHMPRYFDVLIDPYDDEKTIAEAEAEFQKITLPTYTGAGWYGYTYKTHLAGAQTYFSKIPAPKKMLLTGPAHPDRPLRALRGEMLRWYDHWLKGIDTGIMKEPPVTYWVMGANEWRRGADWPLPETQWTKLYLASWERLTAEPYIASSVDNYIPPDVFAQMPPTQTNRIAKLRFLTDPLPHDLLVAGPSVLNLFAAIDQDDTNWIVILKDVGPGSRRCERRAKANGKLPTDLPERELTRGWLKASNRALDPTRSKPWKPWHKLTRAGAAKSDAGQGRGIRDRNLRDGQSVPQRPPHLRRDHQPRSVDRRPRRHQRRIHPLSCLLSRTVVHSIYHDAAHPSHLLLPVIPAAD